MTVFSLDVFCYSLTEFRILKNHYQTAKHDQNTPKREESLITNRREVTH